MEDRLPRRLAAILYADVAEYSRLTGEDEDATHRTLSDYLDHIARIIESHRGQVMHYAGDAVLAKFDAVVDAMSAAVAIQTELEARNEGLPVERMVQFRIGVNSGDVIEDRGDIYGGGVNVAARLESLAAPGGICISDAVRTAVGKKLDLGYEFLGEQEVKNIAEPVRAYRVVTDKKIEKGTTRAEPAVLELPDKPSIAVLPFTNMSGDPEQEYFSDGITEDLITALAKFRHLSVLSRNSTFVYKGRPVKVEDVGRELGARFVLEGSVRKGGSRVRVSAQLIDAETGAHVWAERFDRELADIFAVQDEIVAAISVPLGFSLIDAAVATRRGRSPRLLTAYDYLLRGRAAWRRGAAIETRDHYLKSVDADPDFATGLACLAFIYAEDRSMQLFGLSIDEEARLARHYAERAITRDDGDPLLHMALGSAFLDLGDLDKAKHHLELACALNPHNPYSRINLGCTIAFMGAHREGLAMIEQAFQLEPRMAPAMQAVPLFCHYLARDYESAIADFARIDNPFAYLYLLLAASHAQLGCLEEAQRAIAEFEARRPEGFDIGALVQVYCDMCRLPEDREQAREGFRKAGLIS